jgi:hypothetical protein
MKFTYLAFFLLAISFFSIAYASSSTAGDVNDVMNTPFYKKMLRSALEDINKKNRSQDDVVLLVDGVTKVNSITIEFDSTFSIQTVHFSLDVEDEDGDIYGVDIDVYAQPLRNSQRVDYYSVSRKHRHGDGGHHHGNGGGHHNFRRNNYWV